MKRMYVRIRMIWGNLVQAAGERRSYLIYLVALFALTVVLFLKPEGAWRLAGAGAGVCFGICLLALVARLRSEATDGEKENEPDTGPEPELIGMLHDMLPEGADVWSLAQGMVPFLHNPALLKAWAGCSAHRREGWLRGVVEQGADPWEAGRAILTLDTIVERKNFVGSQAAWTILSDVATSAEAMALCYVPAGPFVMGHAEGDEPERSEHEVLIPYDYWIGAAPVTMTQYRQYAAAVGQELKSRFPDLPATPVHDVDWYDCVGFCRWLTKTWRASNPPLLPKGWEVRLPTEAEWEKAARGGLAIPTRPIFGSSWTAFRPPDDLRLVENPNPRRLFPWGDDDPRGRANLVPFGRGIPTPAGLYPEGASPHGAEDMTGNVFEWVATEWKPYPYDVSDGRDEVWDDYSRQMGNGVLRGGSFEHGASEARCTHRDGCIRWMALRFMGFRVVVGPALPNGGNGGQET